jgi:hypothetical protein
MAFSRRYGLCSGSSDDRRASLNRRRFLVGTVALTSLAGTVPVACKGKDSTEPRPEDFGAGRGADDTAALQAFLDRLGDGVNGTLDGVYRVSAEVRLHGKRNFKISGGGRIVMAPGVPARHGFGGLRISRCSDFELAGFTIDGNRQQRVPRELPAHNLIFESCQRFRCQSLVSVNAVVDGYMFYSETPARADTHCSNFEMSGCVARGNWRQGCSVVHGRRGRFLSGEYSATEGTAPSAGIDLEADAGSPDHSVDDILLHDVRFEANAGFGLLVAAVARPRNVRVIGCHFVDNRLGAISWGAESGSVERPLVEGFGPTAPRGAIDIPTGVGGNVAITDPIFRRISADGAGQPLVYVHGDSAGGVSIERLTTDGCGAVAALWGPRCRLVDGDIVASRGEFDGAILVYGSGCTVSGNTISDFYGAVIYAEGNDATIAGNRLSDPRHNGRSGCIRASGKNSRIVDNVLTARGAAIAITADAAATVRGNRVSGFGIDVLRR